MTIRLLESQEALDRSQLRCRSSHLHAALSEGNEVAAEIEFAKHVICPEG
jgi:hypothetical protein